MSHIVLWIIVSDSLALNKIQQIHNREYIAIWNTNLQKVFCPSRYVWKMAKWDHNTNKFFEHSETNNVRKFESFTGTTFPLLVGESSKDSCLFPDMVPISLVLSFLCNIMRRYSVLCYATLYCRKKHTCARIFHSSLISLDSMFVQPTWTSFH